MKLPVPGFLTFLASTSSTNLPSNAKWESLPSIPLPRQEHVTLALSSSTIAVLGGIIPAPPNSTSQIPFLTTSLLQLYSIPQRKWLPNPSPAPVALNHPNGAVVNSKIYLLGGLSEVDANITWSANPSSFVYSPKADSWSSLPSIPADQVPRGSAAMGVSDKGVIYLAGGMTALPLTGATQESISDVAAFDTRTNKWIALPAKASKLPAARDHAGAAVIDNKFYVVGGRDKGQLNVRDTVFVLDLDKPERGWVAKKARMPTARGGVAAAVLGNRVWTFGGEGNQSKESGVFDEVEVYDTVKDRWEKVKGGMKVPRHGTSAVGVGGGVYIPGGGTVQGGAPDVAFDMFWP
ncbi:galactose oxidase [Cladorrhinum sp. PSN332]|nr:galactose oxidase [Cladorrhinum sp. PSN332]